MESGVFDLMSADDVPANNNLGSSQGGNESAYSSPMGLLDLHMLIATESIPGIRLPDLAVIEDGTCSGLMQYDAATSVVEYDPNWPHVDATHQARGLFSVKRSSETTARNEIIVNHFSRPGPAPCAILIRDVTGERKTSRVAGADPSLEVEMTYVTADRLVPMINDFSSNPVNGMLLSYTAPQNNRHNLVRAIFTPFVTKVELHEGTVDLDDVSYPLASRTSSISGANCIVMQAPPELRARVEDTCDTLYEFFKEKDIALHQAVLYFMDCGPSQLTFLHCSKLDLKPWDGPKERKTRERRGKQTVSTKAVVVPPPTPLEHHDATQQHIDMLDGITHFGFYSDEQEWIRNTLKRYIITVSRVKLPTNMTVDDNPPYDDKFIKALYDPKYGEKYFRVRNKDGQPATLSPRKLATHDGGTARRKSVMSPEVQGAVNELERNFQIAQLSNGLLSPTSQRRTSLMSSSSRMDDVASPKNARSMSIVSAGDGPLSPIGRSADSPSGRRRSSVVDHSIQFEPSVAFLDATMAPGKVDPEEQQQPQEAPSQSTVHKTSLRTATKAVDEIIHAAPDYRHLGRIRALREKYGSDRLAEDEHEADFKKSVRQNFVVQRATTSLEMRSQRRQRNTESRPASATPTAKISTSPRKAYLKPLSASRTRSGPSSTARVGYMGNLRNNNTKPAMTQRKPWKDVTVRDHKRRTPFRRVAQRLAVSSTIVADEPIPTYQEELVDASMGGYVAGGANFAPAQRLEEPLFIPEQDIIDASYFKPEKVRVPPPPIIERGNSHMSISEERILRERKKNFQSTDALEMIFREDTFEEETLLYRERLEEQRRRERELNAAVEEDRSRRQQAVAAEEEQRRREQQAGHSRSMFMAKYNAQETKVDVQQTCHAFTDILYQFEAESNKTSIKRPKDMVLTIPAHYAPLQREIRSMLIGVGFKERTITKELDAFEVAKLRYGQGTVVATTTAGEIEHRGFARRASLSSASRSRTPQDTVQGTKSIAQLLEEDMSFSDSTSDDFEDSVGEVHQAKYAPTKEYVMPNTAVNIANANAKIQQYKSEVGHLYAEGKWATLDRIKNLVDSEGYTLFDAVLNAKHGMLKRATVAKRASVQQYDPLDETLNDFDPDRNGQDDDGSNFGDSDDGGKFD